MDILFKEFNHTHVYWKCVFIDLGDNEEMLQKHMCPIPHNFMFVYIRWFLWQKFGGFLCKNNSKFWKPIELYFTIHKCVIIKDCIIALGRKKKQKTAQISYAEHVLETE